MPTTVQTGFFQRYLTPVANTNGVTHYEQRQSPNTSYRRSESVVYDVLADQVYGRHLIDDDGASTGRGRCYTVSALSLSLLCIMYIRPYYVRNTSVSRPYYVQHQQHHQRLWDYPCTCFDDCRRTILYQTMLMETRHDSKPQSMFCMFVMYKTV